MHFQIKAFLSERLNLIFVQNGYGKYCIDMEVNDISAIQYPCPKYRENPRSKMEERLTENEKQVLLNAIVKNREHLQEQIDRCGRETDKILILTEPLCSLEVREQIFKDMIAMYEKEGQVFLKCHPRDELDYEKLFPEYPQFDKSMPMEILNYFPGLHFKKVVGVLTEMKGIRFADESIRLGPDFMDRYEDAAVHRQNEFIS